jgi:hypothetical protein
MLIIVRLMTRGKIYYIYDSDKKYRLDCTMDNNLGIINIICNKQ